MSGGDWQLILTSGHWDCLLPSPGWSIDDRGALVCACGAVIREPEGAAA